jgi:hypothetical protein
MEIAAATGVEPTFIKYPEGDGSQNFGLPMDSA